MKKKTIIAGIIISVFLIGIVSAGLLDYFGKITGSVEVKELVFYPDSHIAEEYYNLFINEIPESEELVIVDGENIIFETESLGIGSFYSADYRIYVRAKTNVGGNELLAELWVLDEDENYKQRICETQFEITATQYFSTKDKICHGNELNMDEGDRFALRLSGAGQTANYTLKVGDYSDESKIMRVEVSAT